MPDVYFVVVGCEAAALGWVFVAGDVADLFEVVEGGGDGFAVHAGLFRDGGRGECEAVAVGEYVSEDDDGAGGELRVAEYDVGDLGEVIFDFAGDVDHLGGCSGGCVGEVGDVGVEV